MFPPKCLWFTNKLWVNHGISDRVEKHRYFDSHAAHRQIWNIQHSRGTPMSVKTDVECGKVVLVRIFQTNMILFTERIWNLLKLREFLSNSEWKIWKIFWYLRSTNPPIRHITSQQTSINRFKICCQLWPKKRKNCSLMLIIPCYLC